MNLLETQQRLMTCIFNEHEDNGFVAPIIERGELYDVDALMIYRESILAGLVNALRETYPVCEQLVGEHFFAAMARQFSLRTPSVQPDLNEYGDSLAEFIEHYRPAESVQYLADIARLECLCNKAFLASNERRQNLQELSGLSEGELERIVFYMPRSCFLMVSAYPVDQIWLLHQQDKDDIQVDWGQASSRILVWRPQYEVALAILTNEQYAFLLNLQKSMTLAEACESCALQYPDYDMNSLIDDCLKCGWIEGFYLKDID